MRPRRCARCSKKNELKPHQCDTWCLPAEADAAFVAALEDVLEVYTRPPDPRYPLICFDEAGKELQANVRPSLPPEPGHPARIASEYQRAGQANLFLWCAPHLGQRQVTVTQRRTQHEWAEVIRSLVDDHFPQAERLVLVLDNLNIHTPAAFYAHFPPAEALRLRQQLELHFTPKHGSWLNIAELEFSVLRRQCLDRRIPDQATLEREVAAWVQARNAAAVTIDWQFTPADARIKLKRLYPVLEPDKS